jgi:hypothetical protein
MTIPGRGDLSPRRRQSGFGRWVIVLVIIALLAGGGYAAYVGLTGGSSSPSTSTATTLPRCPLPSTTAIFAPPHQVKVSIVNGSLQTGLAASVGAQLQHRKIRVGSIGNALKVVSGVAVIRYSPDQRRASRTLAAQVAGQPVLTAVSGTNVLDLALGLRFKRLRSPAAAKAIELRVSASSAASTSSPTARPSPTCRPRS